MEFLVVQLEAFQFSKLYGDVAKLDKGNFKKGLTRKFVKFIKLLEKVA